MNTIIYMCESLQLKNTIENVANVPVVGDYVFLDIEKLGVQKFKVKRRFINHSKTVLNGIVRDSYYIEVEL